MYLSLCLLTKHESSYLPEWLSWHRSIGVEHFFIVDNGGDLLPVYGSDVDIIPYLADEGIGKQNRAYDLILSQYSSQTVWMGFIDTDEFLVPRYDLVGMLREREHCSGLGVSWKMFGSNHLMERPESVLKGFTKWGACPEASHIKSIVQPVKVSGCATPHSFRYHSGGCFSFSGVPIESAWTEPDYSLIQLNHYWTRSFSEWKQKYERGRGDGCGRHRFCQYDEYQTYANEIEELPPCSSVSKHSSVPLTST